MKLNLRDKLIMRLSDKILLIISGSLSIVVIAVVFLVGFSVEQIILIGGGVYTVGFLMTYSVSWKFSQRMLELTRRIEEMAAGHLSRKLEIKSKDEIGQLAHAVNELTSRLETGIAIDVSRHKGISQAKTDFVNIASHQLRTPLSIIKWYIDYLLSGDAGKLTDEQKKYLKEAYKGNERLIDLVNGLLDVSRIDLGTFSIEPEIIDLKKAAENALAKFSRQIEKNQFVIKKEFGEIPKINLDPRLTEIIFEHIISNSIKYTPKRGIIKITIKKEDEEVLIKISDSGCGIPREQQPKIFTKLFRATNAKKMESVGTGLGLYVVKAIVEKSGGKIWFESPSLDSILDTEDHGISVEDHSKNKGTTFFVTIPLQGMKGKSGTKKLTSFK